MLISYICLFYIVYSNLILVNDNTEEHVADNLVHILKLGVFLISRSDDV